MFVRPNVLPIHVAPLLAGGGMLIGFSSETKKFFAFLYYSIANLIRIIIDMILFCAYYLHRLSTYLLSCGLIFSVILDVIEI